MLDYDKGLICIEIETRVAKVQFHSQSKKERSNRWAIVRKKNVTETRQRQFKHNSKYCCLFGALFIQNNILLQSVCIY